ncbi:MAG: DUF3592 domain-containing protein [Phycisphaerales bacterium]|jgi:hypothetical protein|nr:DUF3592 domain-containing protein [Phycisphaerales bacterium]
MSIFGWGDDEEKEPQMGPRGQALTVILMGLMGVGVGVYAGNWAYSRSSLLREARTTWTEVPATMTGAELVYDEDSQWLEISYTYAWSDRTFNGRDEHYGSFDGRQEAEAAIEELRDSLRAYVDPEDPSRSLLISEHRGSGLLFVAIVAGVFCISGVWFIYNGVKMLIDLRRIGGVADST